MKHILNGLWMCEDDLYCPKIFIEDEDDKTISLQGVDTSSYMIKISKKTKQSIYFNYFNLETKSTSRHKLVYFRKNRLKHYLTFTETWTKIPSVASDNNSDCGKGQDEIQKTFESEMIGLWKPSSNDSTVCLRFRNTMDGKPDVQEYDSRDGEIFQLYRLKVTPRTIRFDYVVPSTGHIAHNQFTLKAHGVFVQNLTVCELWSRVNELKGGIKGTDPNVG